MSFLAFLFFAVLVCTAHGALSGAPRRLAADVAAGVSDAVVRATDLSQGGAQECPAGCEDGYCAYVATQGGYYCQKCLNKLLVRKSDGLCGCAAGKYSPDGTATCIDCPMGSWCSGGVYTETDYPRAVRCTSNMTTRGMRSTSSGACLNLPGFSYYNLNNLLLAMQCPMNTYSPGLRKQRACVPCPSGFSTMGKVGQSRVDACVVPPGYFLKTPGQAAPCPMGEYKAGIGPDGSCTKCAFGVTTQSSASTSNSSCSLVLAGWYARNMSGTVITTTAPCPQGYYCPGGRVVQTFDPANPALLLASEPSIKPCPQGTWTVDLAATVVSECLTPPGYKTLNGTTVPCEAGSYRSGWTPGAPSCSSCGSGVAADKTDRIIQYDLLTGAMAYVPVTTAPDDCYIRPGQGLYYETLSQSWRAKNCNSNTYGVDKVTYGLSTSSCRPCPANMVASTNRTGYPNSWSYFVSDAATGTEGFISPMACVNQAGFGYNGRIAQPCDRGFWNLADSYGTCKACGYGLTTAAVGAGKKEADCGLAAGFGNNGGTVGPCPAGTYNNATYTPGETTACTPCPTGTTTASEGADSVSQCNLCMGGWGGTSCLTQCGGKGDSASYGVNGRAMDSACTQCSYGNTGFSFQWQMQNDIFVAQPVAAIGADSSWDCVSEFAQLSDAAWYIPTAGNTAMNITTNVDTFVACVALCKDDCEYVTYDYVARTCYVRIGYEPIYMGAPLIAFKAVPSGDVATNAFSVQAASAGAFLSPHRHGMPVGTVASGISNTGSSGDSSSSGGGDSNTTSSDSSGSSSDTGSSDTGSSDSAGSSNSTGSGDPAGSISGSSGHGDGGSSNNTSSNDGSSTGSSDSSSNSTGSGDPTGSSSGSSDGVSNAGGDAAASSITGSSGGSSEPVVKAQEAMVSGASVASGQYSFWIEPNADSVGIQTPAPGRASFARGYVGLQQCLDECDLVSWCAGITMDLFVDVPSSPTSCRLIRGDTSPGRFLRTVTRADVNRLRVPTLFG